MRRPPGFYAHLLELEARAARGAAGRAQAARWLATTSRALLDAAGAVARLAALPAAGAVAPTPTGLAAWHGGGAGHRPAPLGRALAGRATRYDDVDAPRATSSPRAPLDADLQQVDLRARNSWRLTLAEVRTPEMLEVQLVNAVAPFILCSKLKPLMLRATGPATSTS